MDKHRDQVILYKGHKLYVISGFVPYDEYRSIIFDHDENTCCPENLGNDQDGWWDELIEAERLYGRSSFSSLNLAEFALKIGVGSPVETNREGPTDD